MRSGSGRIALNYRVRVGSQDWQSVMQTVMLTCPPCTYGGTRPYFRCPGVVNGRQCQRRVAKLFAGGRYFLCRHCYSLAYASQSEDRHDRLLRRANKRRVALGGEPGTAYGIASRPKGMWQSTYERARLEIGWCEDQANVEFIQRFRHLLSQDDLDYLFCS